MAVTIGSARVDERGKYSGGAPGDQTGKEVSTQNWYLHSKGWVIIRAKDANVRKKIATCMKNICANNRIGYSQSDRYGLYNNVKNKGFDPNRLTINVNTDCSAAIRVCVCYAGINVGDFNTSAEVSVLNNTGKFDIITDDKYTRTSDYLLEGDILVTKTKGHTVAVLNDGPKANSSSKKPTTKPQLANYTIKENTKGNNVKKLQQDLNYVQGSGLKVDGICGTNTVKSIMKFQKNNGLKVDGIYGKSTYSKMKSALK